MAYNTQVQSRQVHKQIARLTNRCTHREIGSQQTDRYIETDMEEDRQIHRDRQGGRRRYTETERKTYRYTETDRGKTDRYTDKEPTDRQVHRDRHGGRQIGTQR